MPDIIPFYKNQSIQIRIDTLNAGLGGATLARILWQKPYNGVKGFWNANIDGTEIVYTTNSGDLDEVGEWLFQPYAEFGATVKRFGDEFIKQRVEDSLL